MNDKITMSRLAAMIAISTGKQKKLCEDFLRELFAIVEEELLKGENVRIKGFGTFKLVEVEPRKSVNVATGEETLIPAHNKVLFVAAKELAAKVNFPFEVFEAVEIADELPTDSLIGEEEVDELEESTVVDNDDYVSFSVDELDKTSSINKKEVPFVKTGGAVELEYDNSSAEDILQPHMESPESQVVEDNEDFVPQDMPVVSSEENLCGVGKERIESEFGFDIESEVESGLEHEFEEEPQKKHKFVNGFVWGFVVALLGVGIVFTIVYFMDNTLGNKNKSSMTDALPKIEANIVDTENSDPSALPVLKDSTVAPSESLSESENDVPTKPSDEQIYDTVSTVRYLTTIAQEHYGNFNLWPIIYEENAKILGHPDRIRPGTKVVVPPLSKYGIDPKNVEQIKEVKRKGVEIYSRFK